MNRTETLERQERERNRILVTCFIANLLNVQVPNSYLERYSIYGKTSYYQRRKTLADEGFIQLSQDSHEVIITLTHKGNTIVSNLLGGSSQSEIFSTMDKYFKIFDSPFRRLTTQQKHNLYTTLLLMYADSKGDDPQQFYRELLKRLAEDLASDTNKREYYERLTMVESLLRYGEHRQNAANKITRLLFEVNEIISRLDKHIVIWSSLGPNRLTYYFVLPLVSLSLRGLSFWFLLHYLTVIFASITIITYLILPILPLTFLYFSLAYLTFLLASSATSFLVGFILLLRRR